MSVWLFLWQIKTNHECIIIIIIIIIIKLVFTPCLIYVLFWYVV